MTTGMRNVLMVGFAALAWGRLSAVEVQATQTGGTSVRWFEEMMPAPDGVRLYTYGSAPAEGVKCPIIIQRNPYVKETRVDVAGFAKGQQGTLARGYARVTQHVRGAGMSEGKRTPYEDERRDGLALLDYVRKLPWYNGEIYLEGGSYLTSVHWAYLDTNPVDVKGAALAIQEVNRYNINLRHGFFKIGLHGGWFVKEYHKTDHALTRNADVKLTDLPLLDFSRRYWGMPVPAFDNPILHPQPEDPYWRSNEAGSGAEARQALLKSTMPVLLRTAFYDIYTEGLCDMWRETPPARRANCALLIDAYDHSGTMRPTWKKGTFAEFPGGSRADANVSNLDWFDAIRKAAKEGRPFAGVPGATAGHMRYFALWENKWIEEPALVDGSRAVTMTLGAGEQTIVYDPRGKPPSFPGSGGIAFGGMEAQPAFTGRNDVVTFMLPPIAEQLDVRGRITAKLAVRSDCEDTSFYVRLTVDKGDGRFLLLRDDILSLGWREAKPYVPGEVRTLDYTFPDHAFRLSPGDKLRVDVASAASAFASHPNIRTANRYAVRPEQMKVAHNVVIADKSAISLPVKGM